MQTPQPMTTTPQATVDPPATATPDLSDLAMAQRLSQQARRRDCEGVLARVALTLLLEQSPQYRPLVATPERHTSDTPAAARTPGVA